MGHVTKCAWGAVPPKPDACLGVNVQEYATAQAMMQDPCLKLGYAHTLGFYDVGDGGEAYYTVVATPTGDQPNGMDVLQCRKCVAELVVENWVTSEQLGAKGDGITDDINCIQRAIDVFGNLLLNEKTYATTKPVYMKSHTRLYGNGFASKISNVGTGWNKNVIVCGYENGQTEQPNAYTNGTAVPFEKTGANSFSCNANLEIGDCIVLGTYESTGSWQTEAQPCIVTEKTAGGYTVNDTVPEGGYVYYFSAFDGQNHYGIPYYTVYDVEIKNISVEQLFDGSGMYLFFICGDSVVLENINGKGNCAIGANFMHNCTVNRFFMETGDSIFDIAEFISNNSFAKLCVVKSSESSNTKNKSFALGRGHGNTYKECNFNLNLDLSGIYSKATVENTIIGSGTIRGTLTTFSNCTFTNAVNAISGNFINCVFDKTTAVIYGSGNVIADSSLLTAKKYCHKEGWNEVQRINDGNPVEISAYDYNNLFIVLNPATFTQGDLEYTSSETGYVYIQEGVGVIIRSGKTYNNSFSAKEPITVTGIGMAPRVCYFPMAY